MSGVVASLSIMAFTSPSFWLEHNRWELSLVRKLEFTSPTPGHRHKCRTVCVPSWCLLDFNQRKKSRDLIWLATSLELWRFLLFKMRSPIERRVSSEWLCSENDIDHEARALPFANVRCCQCINSNLYLGFLLYPRGCSDLINLNSSNIKRKQVIAKMNPTYRTFCHIWNNRMARWMLESQTELHPWKWHINYLRDLGQCNAIQNV